MSTNELVYRDLTDIARAIAAREVSSSEVTEAILERVNLLDAALGSYVEVMADSARGEAAAADKAISRGDALGPLHGVPVAVKDLCDASGVRTIAGMPRVRGAIEPATSDATVVQRLRQAGAVLLGKLQLTEGAVAHHHPDVRPPLNPHNPNYWAGASSSGSGAATAAGLCYASLGSDTGGSIRFPSFAHGLTGLKQSWGRVSRAGVVPLSWSLDHVGPITRSAADCAAVLGAIAGQDPRDPTALSVPVPDYSGELGLGLAGLRIGFDEAYATEQVDAEIAQSIRDALTIFKDGGASIVPVGFPDTAAAIDAWFPLCAADAAAAHAATYPARKSDYGPGLADLLDTGLATSGVEYANAHDVRQNFRGRMLHMFNEVDIVIVPAFMRQNLTLAEFETFGSRETDWPELVRFTAPFDIAGTPTLSLPSGFNGDGAPFGFQLAAGHLNESGLTRAGHVYQQATSWHRQRPQQLPS